MSKFTLTINTDSSAFDDPGIELRTLLEKVAAKAEAALTHRSVSAPEVPILSTDGNTVGHWSYTPDPEETTT